MADELSTAVYAELRRLASAKLAHEAPDHLLDATALVHEVYLKLGGDSFATRSAFLRAAAAAMRRILVDEARTRHAQKRGSDRDRVPLDPDQIVALPLNSDVIAIHEALTKFAAVDSQAAELVTLRYFGGLTVAEAAEAVGVSSRTADRLWVFARAWLYRELSETFLA